MSQPFYTYRPTPILLRPLQWIYSIYAMVLFLVLMFIIFPFVIIASFFGKIKGGNFIYWLCKIWGNVWLPMIGIIPRNTFLEPIEKDKQYVFVANHISYMDIPIIFQAIRQKHFRILGKIELAKIPVFGFLYRNAVVMVNRTDAEARAKSIRQLKSVIQKNISVFIFPEGTFNETENPMKPFYDGAFRIAIETQTPIKPIVFLDHFYRLNYTSALHFLPGRSRSIILPAISVEGLTLKDTGALKEKTYQAMEQVLRKYKDLGVTVLKV